MKKLQLNKKTIASLNKSSMQSVKGGGMSGDPGPTGKHTDGCDYTRELICDAYLTKAGCPPPDRP